MHSCAARRDRQWYPVSAAETLVARLDGVRARGAGQWSARGPGPVHERGDRSSGLGIKQVDDRVLVNCPAGCSPLEIVQSIGLDLRDLFDKPLTDTAIAPVRQPPFPIEMARRLLHYATVMVLAADDLRHGKALNKADFDTVVNCYHEIDQIVTTVETWPRSAVRS